MSDKRDKKNVLEEPSTPKRLKPGSPRLSDRVKFYEQIWGGGAGGGAGDASTPSGSTHVHTRRATNVRDIESSESSSTRITRKVLRTVTTTTTTVKVQGGSSSPVKQHYVSSTWIGPSTSRTPSEEVLDSAYHTQFEQSHQYAGYGQSQLSIGDVDDDNNPNLSLTSNGNKSSSPGTSRFTSVESLRKTPSRERLEWDSDSSGRNSSQEWYSDYRTQSFQHNNAASYFNSHSEYDKHISVIRGQHKFNLFIFFIFD